MFSFLFRFDCMTKMDNNEVDLLTLEAGQGYFAGRYHTMRPILAEKYDIGNFDYILSELQIRGGIEAR